MPIRKDKDGRWHAEACVARRRLHRSLPEGATASDAKRVEAELTSSLHASKTQPSSPDNDDPLLTVLVADYTERHALTLRSPETAQFHAYRLGPWLEGRRASETREVVAAMVRDMTGHYKPATINRSLGALKKALRMAFDAGMLSTDESARVRRIAENNQRTVYLSLQEVKKLADKASEPVRASIWIALLTGCRRGEVCKIRPEHILEDRIRIPAGNTKTLRYREVPIVPALRPWLKHLPLSIGFEGLKSGFRRAREAAGMAHVNYHDLRHSCASILIANGTDLYTVSKILGHTSVKTTERYSHMQIEAQRDALAKAFG